MITKKSICDDIIHLQKRISQNHPQMPLCDRTAQFAPFAALTGCEAAVGETARLTRKARTGRVTLDTTQFGHIPPELQPDSPPEKQQ